MSRRRVALFVVLDVVVLLPVGSMLWHPVAKGGPTLAVWLLTLLGWQSLLLWLYQTVLRRPSQPSLGPGVVALGLVVVLPMAFTMARVLPDTGLAPPAFLMAAGALAGFWAWLCAR